MKRKILLLIILVATMTTLSACRSNESSVKIQTYDNMIDSEYNTTYQILLNSGSCFVYTFKDEATGVWYIASSKGVTPRLNADGTLYTD